MSSTCLAAGAALVLDEIIFLVLNPGDEPQRTKERSASLSKTPLHKSAQLRDAIFIDPDFSISHFTP
jgi:hypothetical protein